MLRHLLLGYPAGRVGFGLLVLRPAIRRGRARAGFRGAWLAG